MWNSILIPETATVHQERLNDRLTNTNKRKTLSLAVFSVCFQCHVLTDSYFQLFTWTLGRNAKIEHTA